MPSGLPPRLPTPQKQSWPLHLPTLFRLVGSSVLGGTERLLLSGVVTLPESDIPSPAGTERPDHCVLQLNLAIPQRATRPAAALRWVPPRPYLGSVSGSPLRVAPRFAPSVQGRGPLTSE